MRKGSVLYCEVCSKTGLDHLPILQRDPKTDPPPEKKPADPAAASKNRKEKRRQSRLPSPA
jgi:hypothetical protein